MTALLFLGVQMCYPLTFHGKQKVTQKYSSFNHVINLRTQETKSQVQEVSVGADTIAVWKLSKYCCEKKVK